MQWIRSGDWSGDDAECVDNIIFEEQFALASVHANDPADGVDYYLIVESGDENAMDPTLAEVQLGATDIDDAIAKAEMLFSPYDVPTYIFSG